MTIFRSVVNFIFVLMIAFVTSACAGAGSEETTAQQSPEQVFPEVVMESNGSNPKVISGVLLPTQLPPNPYQDLSSYDGYITFDMAADMVRYTSSLLGMFEEDYRLPRGLLEGCGSGGTGCEDDLEFFVDIFAPEFHSQGFTSREYRPKIIAFSQMAQVNPLFNPGNTSEMVSGSSLKCQDVKLNDNYVNPLVGWPLYAGVKSTAHEIGHVAQGEDVCTDGELDAMVEATAEIMTAEVLSAQVNKGQEWAVRPMLYHLRTMALRVALIRSIEADDFEPYLALRKEVEDSYMKYLRFETFEPQKIKVSDMREYGEKPLSILLTALKTGESVEGLALRGVYHEKQTSEGMDSWYEPRVPDVNDFITFMGHIELTVISLNEDDIL